MPLIRRMVFLVAALAAVAMLLEMSVALGRGLFDALAAPQ